MLWSRLGDHHWISNQWSEPNGTISQWYFNELMGSHTHNNIENMILNW